MKPVFILLTAMLLVSCSETSTQPARPAGHLVVFVGWDGAGLPDRQVEIVETGETKYTDGDGLATFDLKPGTYVLRAYVNGGGPSLYHDQQVEIAPGEETRVVIVDCLICV
jgi:hypothetical protein